MTFKKKKKQEGLARPNWAQLMPMARARLSLFQPGHGMARLVTFHGLARLGRAPGSPCRPVMTHFTPLSLIIVYPTLFILSLRKVLLIRKNERKTLAAEKDKKA